MKNRKDIERNILEWAKDRDLLKTTPEAIQIQTLKLVAEVGEFCDEIIKGNWNKTRLELGDVEVVLTIIKEQMRFAQCECIEAAHDKNKNRTGKTINNNFVKTSDL